MARVAGVLAGAAVAAVLATAGSVAVPGSGHVLRVEGEFAPASAGRSAAVTYDSGWVPPGARIQVVQDSGRQGAAVELRVAGLRPGHAYGAHVHTGACTADPADAGGHYQHREDPVQSSEDPDYVNPHNEVWLDFTPDEHGEGFAAAHHRWGFRPGEANSVVIHQEPGGAGERLACFTVPFEPRG
ncbi:superoxide dismutase family protein [Streptomyces sp. SCSIO ZS0520]|uniref:superoxide dismutase family protein n=1 Tax=Streptomyces sp. SCSIO ZS0520 TaxID=2892996 RepID=UPI003988166F